MSGGALGAGLGVLGGPGWLSALAAALHSGTTRGPGRGMLRRCPGPKVGLLHRAWICFPRRRSSLCCSATSRGSFGLQSTAPAPFPLPGVSLETVSWHGGRMIATAAILRNSQAEDVAASRAGKHHLFLHAAQNGTALLEFCLSPGLFLHP